MIKLARFYDGGSRDAERCNLYIPKSGTQENEKFL